MPGSQPAPGSRTQTTLWLAASAAALLALVAYTAATYSSIARQADKAEVRQADVIVIFGAAEYAGRPSPVFKARLDHGLELYRRGLGPFLIVTGGAGPDLEHTEGGVGRAYLVSQGVPESVTIAETQSGDTNEATRRVAVIMRANGMHTALVVSDGYHIWRIKQMMAAHGVDAFGAPRPLLKPLSPQQKTLNYLREVLSVTLWRLNLK